MRTPGILPKNLDIHHMTQPRYRVPIARVARTKRPSHRRPIAAAEHHRVVSYVIVVIVVNELRAGHRPGAGDDRGGQTRADPKRQAPLPEGPVNGGDPV